MSKAFKVLELFLNNPSDSFSVYDVQKSLRVSWVTANDNMVPLIRMELLVEESNSRYCLNKDKLELLRKLT